MSLIGDLALDPFPIPFGALAADDGISLKPENGIGGTLVDRSRTGDVFGDNTLLSIANRTCFEERGLFGCFRLLRRLVREVSERHDARRRSFS